MDERNGLPSASGMERCILCPGSFNLSKGLNPEERPGESEYSRYGTALAQVVEKFIHDSSARPVRSYSWETSVIQNAISECGIKADVVASHPFDSEAAIEVRLRQIQDKLMDDADKMIDRAHHIWDQIGATDPRLGDFYSSNNIVFVERRIWANGRNYHRKLSGHYSAKPDLVVFNTNSKVALVIDFKSGWKPVAPAAKNHQIKSIVGLLYRMLDGSAGATARAEDWAFYGAIVQPNLKSYGFNIAKFDSVDAHGHSQFYQGVAKASINEPEPIKNLKPTEKACEYCEARLVCPALKQIQEGVAYRMITPTDFRHALDLKKLCEIRTKAWEEKAREVLEKDPNAIPGVKLVPSGTTTKISDPVAAFQSISDIIPPEKFMEACTVGIGKLTDIYAKASTLPKTKARDALVTKLGSVITQEPKAPKLVRDDVLQPIEDHES